VPDELHSPLKHHFARNWDRIGSSGQDLAEIDIEEIAVGQARVTIAKAKRGGHRDLFSRV
jgi:predicted DNA-binding WGR domain protein